MLTDHSKKDDIRKPVLFSGNDEIAKKFLNLDSSFRRVFLVANNKKLQPETFANLITSTSDLIIQFNKCLHWNQIRLLQGQHMIFFRRHFDTMIHHGFPCSPEIEGEINDHPDRYWLAFSGVRSPNLLPSYANSKYVVLDEEAAMLHMTDYPLISDIDFSAPSSGHLLLRALTKRNERMKYARFLKHMTFFRKVIRLLQAQCQIFLVGFEPAAGDGFWSGHNWAYEKDWLEGLKEKEILTPESDPMIQSYKFP